MRPQLGSGAVALLLIILSVSTQRCWAVRGYMSGAMYDVESDAVLDTQPTPVNTTIDRSTQAAFLDLSREYVQANLDECLQQRLKERPQHTSRSARKAVDKLKRLDDYYMKQKGVHYPGFALLETEAEEAQMKTLLKAHAKRAQHSGAPGDPDTDTILPNTNGENDAEEGDKNKDTKKESNSNSNSNSNSEGGEGGEKGEGGEGDKSKKNAEAKEGEGAGEGGEKGKKDGESDPEGGASQSKGGEDETDGEEGMREEDIPNEDAHKMTFNEKVWLQIGWMLMFILILICLFARAKLAEWVGPPVEAVNVKAMREAESIQMQATGSTAGGGLRQYIKVVADVLHGDGWVGTCMNIWIVILSVTNYYSYSVLTEYLYLKKYEPGELAKLPDNLYSWPEWLGLDPVKFNTHSEMITMIVFTVITVLRLAVVPFLPEWKEVHPAMVLPRYILSNLYIGLEIFALVVSYHGVAQWATSNEHDDLNLLWMFIFRTFEMWERAGHGLGARKLNDMVSDYGNLLISAWMLGIVIWFVLSGCYFLTMKGNGGELSTWKVVKYEHVDKDHGKIEKAWDKFESIPSTMWFCLINLLKEHPLADAFVTLPQRICVCISCIIGVPLFAIPISILQCSLVDHEEDEEGGESVHKCEQMDSLQHGCTIGLVLFSCVSYFYYTARGPECDYGTLFGLEWTRVTEEKFLLIDAFVGLVFLVEYVIRAIQGKVEYLLSSLGVFDLLSWVPAVVHVCIYAAQSDAERDAAFGLDEWMCALSVLRILKLERIFGSYHDIVDIIKCRSDILATTGLCCLLTWFLFSELLYWTDHDNYDGEMRETYGSNMRSLWAEVINLHGEWPWADYTAAGKAVGACIGFFSIMIFCIPTSIFSEGFMNRVAGDIDNEAASRFDRTRWQKHVMPTTPGIRRMFYDLFYEHMYKHPSKYSTEFKVFRMISICIWGINIITTVISTLQPSEVCQLEKLGVGQTEATVTCARLSTFRTFFLVMDWICVMWFIFEYVGRTIGLGIGYSISLIGIFDLLSLGCTIACLFPTFRLQAFQPTFTGFAWEKGQLLRNLKDDVTVPGRLLRLFVMESYLGSLHTLRNVMTLNRRPISRALYALVAFWFMHATLLYLFESGKAIKWKTEDEEGDGAAAEALVQLARKAARQGVRRLADPDGDGGEEGEEEEAELEMTDRYVSVLRALQYSILHIFGDYPETDYNFPSKCVHFVGILAGIGLMGAFIGVFIGGFTTYLQEKRRAQMKSQAEDRLNRVVWIATMMQKSFKERKAGKRPPLQREPLSNFEKQCRAIHCETTALGYWLKRFFEAVVVLAIINTLIFTLPFVDEDQYESLEDALLSLELVFTGIFVAEYVIDFVAAPRMRWKRQRIVDLICLLPGLGLLFNQIVWDESNPAFEHTMEAFTMVRALRIMHFRALRADMAFILKAMHNALPLLAEPAYLAFCVWIWTSALFWWCENTFTGSKDEGENRFKDKQLNTDVEHMTSVPSAMFWCCIYLIGEWANVDFTFAGSRISIFYVLFGIAIFSMPVGILAEEIKAGLIQVSEQKKFVEQTHASNSLSDLKAADKKMTVRRSVLEVAEHQHGGGSSSSGAGVGVGSTSSDAKGPAVMPLTSTVGAHTDVEDAPEEATKEEPGSFANS